MEVKSIPRLELLQVAEAVSREKLIDKEEVITAMEEAIEKAARSNYGLERDIRANIDRKNGSINIAQYTEVVETVENFILLPSMFVCNKGLKSGRDFRDTLYFYRNSKRVI